MLGHLDRAHPNNGCTPSKIEPSISNETKSSKLFLTNIFGDCSIESKSLNALHFGASVSIIIGRVEEEAYLISNSVSDELTIPTISINWTEYKKI